METIEKIKELLYSLDQQNSAIALDLINALVLACDYPELQPEKDLIDLWGIDIFWEKTISLYDNQLQTLPESIGKLQNLEYLYLYNNKLKSLPDSIGKLQNLKRLYLWNNQLQKLPEDIAQLQNLERLYLWNNPINQAEQEKIKKLLPNTEVLF